MHEEAWRFTVPGAAFDDLLRRPFRRGMPSDLDMQDLAVGVTDRDACLLPVTASRLVARAGTPLSTGAALWCAAVSTAVPRQRALV